MAHRGSAGDELLRRYLDEIGAHALLGAADEVELASILAAGRDAAARLETTVDPVERHRLEGLVQAGVDAKRRFIQANLRLVVSIARRYEWSGIAVLDLIQEGNLGLMRAVDKFDHTKGFKFSTYATWWIRQAIGRALGDVSGPIRLPAHVKDSFPLVDQCTARLSRTLGRPPTISELARATGLSEERVALVRQHRGQVLSLSSSVGPDSDTELGDLLPADESGDLPYEAAAAALDRASLHTQLTRLTPRERAVLAARFGLDGHRPATLSEVGESHALTRERIRQIEAKALSKLRHPSLGRPGAARS